MDAISTNIDHKDIDYRQLFAGIILLDNEADRSLDDYLSEFDYYEEFDPKKQYSRKSFLASYKRIMREYQHHLLVVNQNRFYVVAKRMRTDLEKIESLCVCIRCSASAINPLKYLWCPMCTGCLKAAPALLSKNLLK